jgi:hypothetical protein
MLFAPKQHKRSAQSTVPAIDVVSTLASLRGRRKDDDLT